MPDSDPPPRVNSLNSEYYRGAFRYLDNASKEVSMDAVGDDQEEESESFDAAVETDTKLGSDVVDARLARSAETADMATEASPVPMKANVLVQQHAAQHTKLHANLKAASQNIITTNTLKEYTRLWKQFVDFCTDEGFISEEEQLQETGRYRHLPADLPAWVSMWIMNKCDDLDIHTGEPKDLSNGSRATYNTGQKMRAAMTHKYGRDFGLGTQIWLEDPLSPGHFRGNPSLSTTVSQYMISLRRRKVHAGEVVTSARAIDEATLKKVWTFNESFPIVSTKVVSKQFKEENPEYWGGRNLRTMEYSLQVNSFLCLLRYDEALHIRWDHITVEKLGENKYRMRLELPFRKTHQNGGCAPFMLYNNLDKPHMCPVRAFAKWSETCKQLNIPREGYVYRKRVGFDGLSADPEAVMSTEVFLECFRNNLLDVGIDPRPYGTHSFRRGGCQYLSMTLRWPLRTICSWGGWSENFDNQTTIFKYLLSWNDNPTMSREDFFNPDRPGVDPCTACGRTCLCA